MSTKMRFRFRSAFTLTLIGALSAWTGQAGAQTDQERAGARAAATQGAEAFEAGNYKDALSFMEKAESLVHALPHLLYIARSHEKLGNLVQARETYLKIGRERLKPNDPDAFREAQEAAAQELRALEPRVPSVTLKVEGPTSSDLTITVDGQPLSAALVGIPTPTNPGEHVYEAKAAGAAAVQRVTLAEGAKETVVLTLQPTTDAAAAPPQEAQPATAPVTASVDAGTSSKNLKLPAYVALGVGVVGAGLGTVFFLSGSSKSSDADDKFDQCVGGAPDGVCRDPSAQSEIEELDSSAASQKTLGVVGFAIGGVGIATGVTLLLLDGGRKEPAPSASGPTVKPLFGYKFVGLSGRF